MNDIAEGLRRRQELDGGTMLPNDARRMMRDAAAEIDRIIGLDNRLLAERKAEIERLRALLRPARDALEYAASILKDIGYLNRATETQRAADRITADLDIQQIEDAK